ncbi:MAG: hypothetical protein ACI4PZ_05420 [Akkermansia sp.]
MKRYLSDYLPVGMVDSLRRCLHAPAYVVLLCLLLLMVLGLDESEDTFGVCPAMCGFFLIYIIPIVAAGWGCGEAREAASMARLAPLSSWRLVLGTWLSGTLQCLLLALLLGAVYAVKQVDAPSLWCALGLTLLLSFVAVPLWMASLSLGGAVRWAACVLGASWLFETMTFIGGVSRRLDEFPHAGTVLLDPAFIGAVLLLIVLLLNVARRAYALPTENLWLLPRVLTPLLVLTPSVGGDEFRLLFLSCGACWYCLPLLNVLLPYSRRVPVRAVLPRVPTSWQRPGVLPDLGVMLLTGAALLWMQPELRTEFTGWLACDLLLGLALMLTCCRSESTSKWLVFLGALLLLAPLLRWVVENTPLLGVPEPYRMWLLPAVVSLLLLWIVVVAYWKKC